MSKFSLGVIVEVGYLDAMMQEHVVQVEYMRFDEEDDLLYCRDHGEIVTFDAEKITRIVVVE